MKILREQEKVNPDKQNNFDKIPLELTTRHSYEQVVVLLLSHETIIPSTS